MKYLLLIVFSLYSLYCNSQIVISEIQSSNSSTILDEFNQNDDWIELYNPTDTAVDIGGMVLKDNVDTWMVPVGDASTVIPSKGYFLLWADDEEAQGKFHTNFRLSAANGEFLGLFKADSVTLIESVNFPPMSGDQSFGKCGEDWILFNAATPLTENACAVSSEKEYVKIDSKIKVSSISGKIRVDVFGYTGEELKFALYSFDGRLILNESYQADSFSVDVVDMEKGLFLVSIQMGKTNFSKKIVVE